MAVVHPWSRCQETRPTRVSCEPHLQSALSPHPVLVPGVRVADNLHQVLGVDAADSLLGQQGDSTGGVTVCPPQASPTLRAQSVSRAAVRTSLPGWAPQPRPFLRAPSGQGPQKYPRGLEGPPGSRGKDCVQKPQGHGCYRQGACPAQGAGRTRGPEPVGGALPLEAPAMNTGLP